MRGAAGPNSGQTHTNKLAPGFSDGRSSVAMTERRMVFPVIPRIGSKGREASGKGLPVCFLLYGSAVPIQGPCGHAYRMATKIRPEPAEGIALN
jgi:hypothetical protein